MCAGFRSQILELDPNAGCRTDPVAAFDTQAKIPVVQPNGAHHIDGPEFTVPQDKHGAACGQQLIQMCQNLVALLESAIAFVRQHAPHQRYRPLAVVYADHQDIQALTYFGAVNLDPQTCMAQRAQNTKCYRVIQQPLIDLLIFKPAPKALRHIIFLYIQWHTLGYSAQAHVPRFKDPDHQQRQGLDQFRSAPFLPSLQRIVQLVVQSYWAAHRILRFIVLGGTLTIPNALSGLSLSFQK